MLNWALAPPNFLKKLILYTKVPLLQFLCTGESLYELNWALARPNFL